ncbi:hypothetical protein [Nitrogeniibacter aestuarii]|uniref:hypothetical protein n=1 Tax=Nitrogeniibacter aestuarii TaxID=2815343 RepID=UPI001E565D0A|nr:hypothetical protein [Nitrogeniibacter aestuarii]
MNKQPPLARPDGHTASGQRISFLLPSTTLANIDDVALALANTCRLGGHTRQFFSNAQFAVLLSEIVPERHAWEGLLCQAYKAIIGDPLPSICRYFGAYQAFEARMKAASRAQFGLPEVMSEPVLEALLQLKATELHQFGPKRIPLPDELVAIKPLTFSIPEMAPIVAYRAFLDRHEYLWREDEARRGAYLDGGDSA